jgi:hypothetical protein
VFEARYVFLAGGEDIGEGWRRDCGRTNGEAEAVCLVVVVVGILPDYDGFDGMERGMAGPVRNMVLVDDRTRVEGWSVPAVDFLEGREDLLARVDLFL